MSNDLNEEKSIDRSHRINLDDDTQVKETIGKARDGVAHSAWFLIHQIRSHLRDRRVSAPLFDYAADFFDELLDQHNANDRVDPRKALAKLNILPSRGQPKRDQDEAISLAARLYLLIGEVDQETGMRSGLTQENALDALADTDLPVENSFLEHGSYARKAYLTALASYEEGFRLTEPAEIEVLAGISRNDLLEKLQQAGKLTRDQVEMLAEDD